MTLLTDAEIRKLLDTEGTWNLVDTSAFPAGMTAISGKLGSNAWLVTAFKIGSVHGYDGTVTLPVGHFYRLTPETAKAAYLKGKTWLDSKTKA